MKTGTDAGSRFAHVLSFVAFATLGCGTAETDSQVELPDVPAAPGVVILEPADGAELDAGPIRIVMRAENVELAPAGEDRPNTAHLHLFINQPVTAVGTVIPAGVDGTVHLGQAQSEYEIPSAVAGEYTVIAVLGDFAHRTIEVQAMDTVRFRVREP